MSNPRAVIFSTDGQRDYVTTPDGQKHILGVVSVLKIIAKLVPSTIARKALDEFNKTGETMVPVDLDAMFEMLAPKRPNRFATEDLLIQSQDRTLSEKITMSEDKAIKDAIQNQIGAIERQLGLLNDKAKESGGQPAADMKAEAEKLGDLVKWLQKPSPYGDQSKNDMADGLKGETPGGAKTASYDILVENSNLAETVIQQASEASDAIDRLVQAGRKFNAAKAREDLHDITARVSEILANVDLAQSWVSNDLNALAERSAHIHGLFHGAK